MIQELRTFLIRCDGEHCGHAQSVVTQSSYPSLPEGWTTKSVDNCGMTNYSKTIHLCGYCSSLESKSS